MAAEKQKRGFSWGVFALAVVIFIGIKACSDDHRSTASDQSNTATASPASDPPNTQAEVIDHDVNSAPAAEVPKQDQTAWTYFDNTDKVSGKQIHFASVDALELLEFGFPYNGGSTATIQLRKHPRHGTDVILHVDKGQFVCGVEECAVMVRFDDGRAERYRAVGPSDYSSTELFIEPASKFIGSAKKAKQVVIEANFYQSGDRAMVFPVEHLTW